MEVTIDTTLKLFNKIVSCLLSSLFNCATSVVVLETFPYRALRAFSAGNIIDDACSAYLSTDSQPQVSSTVEELCFLVMGFLQKPQGLDEKDNTKRFLFHYSKTHDSGNSDIMSSVLHPLLQLVPQLNERRLKRYKLDVCKLKLCMVILLLIFFLPLIGKKNRTCCT
uniref:Neuromedin U n=1 Tax=Zosterops lateralis melanops TaxID=1220523 RepID=A0A8D2PVT1_ZOSLA